MCRESEELRRLPSLDAIWASDSLTERVNSGLAFDLKVEVADVLGTDQFLSGMVGGDALTARVDPNLKASPGDRVRLSVDTWPLHLFEPASDKAHV